jgi:hypothetical protein
MANFCAISPATRAQLEEVPAKSLHRDCNPRSSKLRCSPQQIDRTPAGAQFRPLRRNLVNADSIQFDALT